MSTRKLGGISVLGKTIQVAFPDTSKVNFGPECVQ